MTEPHWVPQPFHPQGPPAPPAPPRRAHAGRHAGLLALGAGAVAAGATFALVAAGAGPWDVDGTGSLAQGAPTQRLPQVTPGPAGGGSGGGSSGSASSAQQRGVAIVESVLGYQRSESAGTGIVLTPTGEVLTNNHVIDGATTVRVVIAATGASYSARVVGTDPSDDVAVLQLANASGLTTATIDTTPTPAVGDAVTAVGNAGGTGTLTTATGTIRALEQTITASDDNGANAERLHGLIEIDAPIVSGDSGGPLYDASGQVIGMDTAASVGGRSVTGYAIPIDDALRVAAQIEKGVETSSIHIGNRGLLGVSVVTTSGGAGVESVVPNSAAARAGIVPGDVITAVGSTPIRSAQDLSTFVHGTDPGRRVRVSWTDAAGAAHTAVVTLGNGPAD